MQEKTVIEDCFEIAFQSWSWSPKNDVQSMCKDSRGQSGGVKIKGRNIFVGFFGVYCNSLDTHPMMKLLSLRQHLGVTAVWNTGDTPHHKHVVQ